MKFQLGDLIRHVSMPNDPWRVIAIQHSPNKYHYEIQRVKDNQKTEMPITICEQFWVYFESRKLSNHPNTKVFL